jgi:hypothetical protein
MLQTETAPWLLFRAWNTDGTPKEDLVYNETGIVLYQSRNNEAKSTITLSNASSATDWAAGKFWQISGNLYRVGASTASISSYTGFITVQGSYTGGTLDGIAVEIVVVPSTHTAANVLAALGTGTWATAIPWNAAWDAEVQSEVNDALVALDLDSALIAQGAERAVNVDVNHRVHSHVYDMQANTITASALAADAGAEIAATVWSAATRSLTDKTGFALSATGLDLVTAWTTNITGSLSGNVGGIAGTINTLDELDTAQDTQHGTTRTAVDDAFTVIKGATWSGTTDTLEAIRDRGDVAWITGGGSGTGARTITVTVDDGTDPLENAMVRMTEGVNTYTALSDVTGVATFNLDDATYVVAITKSGYSYAGTTLLVNGTEAETYSMTQVTPTIPDDPALCTVTIPVVNQYGAALVGEVVEIRFNQFTVAATATAVVLSPPPTLTSDANGNVVVELLRDADYSVFYGKDDYIRRLDFSVPDADSYAVGE